MEPYIVNVSSRVGIWGVEGTDHGISRIYMPTERQNPSRGPAPRTVTSVASQLEEYFAGTRRHFSVPFDDTGATNFQRDVWVALLAIPYGQVRTYAQVAAAVQRPRAARAVGNANHANPWPIIVPCHRVVAAHGLGGYGGGDDVKQFLLELEGVAIG